MKVLEKINKKAQNIRDNEGVLIAFLGDSVTQGCFELYKKKGGGFDTVFDRRHSYEQYFSDIFAILYPNVPVNILNAGISGDNARHGAERVENDVIRHNPDLTVVCYGLNDCNNSERGMERYIKNLEIIFDKLSASGSEIIFMTPNMMNTKISHNLDEDFVDIANDTMERQNSGLFDTFIQAARELCASKNIPVCDCYAIWKKLYENGVDTTELLSNYINHPTREMDYIFAYELVKTIFFA